MLRPRRFDEAGRRAFLDEVRPRFVLLRVRSSSANITWGMPLWAAEEIVAFALGAAAVVKTVLPLMPRAWRVRLDRGMNIAGRRVDFGLGSVGGTSSGTLLELWRTVDSFAGGSLREIGRASCRERV